MNNNHEFYIRRCFTLAKKALGDTAPNPLVGSVIIKNNKIIGEGFHSKSGMPHAEVEAFHSLQESAQGATLYCNLEPCCHTNKKTPPCADRIIREGINKVIISNLDPNPQVAGKGVEKLKQAGIEVITGILEEEGKTLNEVFFHHITMKTPFVHLKWAQTLDGKMATTNFDSKWITSEYARENVHKERRLYDSIVVGENTVNQDNPKLTVRLGEEICKYRIVISPTGNVNPKATIFNDKFKDKTIIVIGENCNKTFDVKTIKCKLENNKFDLTDLLEQLYQNKIYSIYVEGGSTLLNSFLQKDIFHRLSVYIAPKILGEGIQSVHALKFETIKESISFEQGHWTQFDQDMLFENKRNVCLQV